LISDERHTSLRAQRGNLQSIYATGIVNLSRSTSSGQALSVVEWIINSCAPPKAFEKSFSDADTYGTSQQGFTWFFICHRRLTELKEKNNK
jgi:hypothetical protein